MSSEHQSVNKERFAARNQSRASSCASHQVTSGSRLSITSQTDSIECGSKPALTPLSLDTVLTVDHLQRLLKIVSFS